MSEATLLRRILREFGSRPDMRLFRNNVGVAIYPDGSRVAYGLCPGSADLIGWRIVEVEGQRIARFVAIEVKRPGVPVRRTNQRRFLKAVAEAGGLAIVARSIDDVRRALGC
jgi:hypothetical protein